MTPIMRWQTSLQKPQFSDGKRLEYLDVARGIAMICIVLGHLGLKSVNRVVYTFHLPIFYFITGYFISTKTSYLDFMKKKVRTLLVPYLITCVLLILEAVLISFVTGGDVLQSAKDMLLAAVYGAGNPVRKPFSVKPIGAIWFLWATFWASMMLRYLVTCRRWIRIIVVAVVFVSSFYSANVIWLPFSLQAGGCALLFLYLGYLLRKMGSFIKSLDKEVKIIAFLAAVFIWCYAIRHFAGFYLVHCRIPNGVIDVLGSIGGCLVLIELSKQIVRYTSHISGILVFAGKYSLLFLCIHLVELSGFPWGYLVRYILAVVQLPSEKIYYMMVVMILKVTFIFCTAYLATKSKMVLKLFGFVPLRESVSQCGQSNTGLLK